MTIAQEADEPRVLREIPAAAIALCCLGGIGLLLGGVIFGASAANPNGPPLPLSPYIPLVIGAVILVFGIHLVRNAPEVMRLNKSSLEFPPFGVSVPWSEIENVEVVHVPQADPAPPIPLLAFTLTTRGRNAIGNQQRTNSPHVQAIEPRPDVCVKLNLMGYGSGIKSAFDFAVDLRKRIAASSGTADETLPLPSLDAPLELRDMAQTGPSSRVYIHDICGEGTAVSDSSLHWATNPLRYTQGSYCAKCGVAMEHMLRWEDTSESLERFRSRMWRHTPLVVKLLQFVIVPALIGLIAAILATNFLPPLPNIPLPIAKAIPFGTGYLLGLALIWMTPLAGVIPACAGLTYHKYR